MPSRASSPRSRRRRHEARQRRRARPATWRTLCRRGPADERDMARAGVFDQQPASLPGGIRETLSQDYLKANFNRGEVTVQHMDLRAAAGAYGGQQQVGADAMSRAVEMSHLIPSSRSAGYPAAQGLTGLAPGESR